MRNICPKCFERNSLFICSCGSVFCSTCKSYIGIMKEGEGIEDCLDFVCFICKRSQPYSSNNGVEGITERQAKEIGWIMVRGGKEWLCPICSGNQDKLKNTILGDEDNE